MIRVSPSQKTLKRLLYQVSTRLTVETRLVNLQRSMRLDEVRED